MASLGLPKTSLEVTPDWIEKVLVEGNPSFKRVKVLSLKTVEFTGGTLSTALRSKVSVSKIPEDGEGKERQEELCLFIKIMPTDEKLRDWANASKMDVTEIETYRIILPELEKLQRAKINEEHERISPFLYFGDYDLSPDTRAWCIILEDLSDTHFMKDFNEGLSLHQLKSCLEKLAHFHALTLAYGKTIDGKYEEKFNFLSRIFKTFDSDPNFIEHFDGSLERVMEDLKNDPNLTYLVPSLRGARENISNLAKNVLDGKDRRILIHGDLWANNYLFSKTNQNECCVLDWQFTTPGNPFWDIGPVAFVSMNEEKTEKHLDEILQSYYNKLNLSCTKLGLGESELLWSSYDTFKADALSFGLYITLVWSILSYPVIDLFPPLRQRYLWVLKTNHRLHPELYA